MPLPPPTALRTVSHTRSITLRAYRREDSLWDLEGHLTDIWPEPVRKADGVLAAGQPMHEMWLRLTVDRSATIVAAVAHTAAGPYDAACAAIAPDYSQLVGVKIARGYRDAVRRLFGRTAGCTHMSELAMAMGTAAMQAMWEDLRGDADARPAHLDGCHALKLSGPQVMRLYPKWYQPETGPAASSPP